jgi:aldose 1-epimerase
MPTDSLVTLGLGDTHVAIDLATGGRIARLTAGGVDLIAPRRPDDDARLGWGSYPMAPFANRVCDGRFEFAGAAYELPITLGPHAIHGTVLDRPWATTATSATSVSMRCDLGPDWPFGGHAEQVVTVESHAVRCCLAVVAADRAMPADLGWHPWFVKPARVELDATAMYELDERMIPTGRLVAPAPPPWDHCFVGVRPPVLHYPGVRVTVTSDCDHWVVYDHPAHATCVEPQTGPADSLNQRPRLLAPGERLARSMVIAWVAA